MDFIIIIIIACYKIHLEPLHIMYPITFDLIRFICLHV